MRRPHLERSFETMVAGMPMRGVALGEGNDNGTPTFVRVHGLGMSGRYMMPTAELLAARGTVFVPDLPSFGGSGKPATVLTISALADGLAPTRRH